MKIFLIILGIIVYIFIGVLYYWALILIDYKKSKTKQSLGCWLSEFSYNNSIDGFMETREQSYFCFSVFWIVTLPFYAVMMLLYHIICLFSNIIKKILGIPVITSEEFKKMCEE